MSEEFVPLRKNPKKALGRGLGSLLGEMSTMAEPTEFKRVETVLPNARPELKGPGEATPNTSSATPVAAKATSTTTPTPPTTSAAAPAPTASVERVWRVAIEKLVPNKEQPRKRFESEKLQELANSIKEKGILLPIIVRPIGADSFEIVAGERRWRAAQLAGLKEIPILIRKTEGREALELALIENVQRQDITPIEEAEAYGLLASRYGLTQQQIAEKVSKDRSTVANLMRLMGLSSEVKVMMKSGELQLGQAKVLLAVEDQRLQHALAKKVVKQALSVRATERLVAKAKALRPDEILEIEDTQIPKAQISALRNELQQLLGTKVDVEISGQRSKVAVHFYSTPELNQFIDRLRRLGK